MTPQDNPDLPVDPEHAARPVVERSGSPEADRETVADVQTGTSVPGAEEPLSAEVAADPRPRQGAGAVLRFEEVVTGQFDADEADPAVELPKRVLAPQPESPKLHKVLAQAGLGSRLEMEQLIMEGRISVNAEPAHIGQRVQFGDTVKINGKPIRVRIDPPPPRVIAYHKPTGEVVTHDDPQNRPTVFRRLPKLFQGKWQSVGRLDLNTEGLLLLTSSGELANRLMHPRFGLEREYAVRVLGALSNEEKKRLLEGVQLDDGSAQFTSIEPGGGEGANCWYKVTLSEGRNREVRRMFEAVGHAVSRLIRIRYGAVVLPRGLKRGAFVELDERDILALTGAADRSAQRDDPRTRHRNPELPAGEGDARQGRGPRRQNRPPGARGPANRGFNDGPMPTRQADPAGHEEEFADDPHELQPPANRSAPHDSATIGTNRNRGAGARGGQAGMNSRAGQPGGGFGRGAGGGPRGKGPAPGQKRRDPAGDRPADKSGAAQPDPMKTSFGYIGADTFTRQRDTQGQRRGGGSGGGGGGGAPRRGAGGNGGGNRGGNRGGGNRGNR
ncbi:MAG: ribosomal large subunit pseudouridine synthase [Polaromonas sp.]|nr:ribosomal large subunit pseudouridine synthase [Polaromonas sp.]